MRILYWIAVIIAAIVLSAFAVSNRQSVSLGLWPFSYVLGLPLFLLVFVALLIGCAVGVLGAWVAGRRGRRELRHSRRRIGALERELAATQAQFEDGRANRKSGLPAEG